MKPWHAILAAMMVTGGLSVSADIRFQGGSSNSSLPLAADVSLSVAPDTQPSESDRRSAKLEADLEKRLDAMTFKGTKLSAALKQWADKAGIAPVVNWKALEAAGVPADQAVTVELKGMPARKALREILAAASEATGFMIDDGEVIVSTRDDLNSSRYQTMRVYDVGFIFPSAVPYSGEGREFADTLYQLIKTVVAEDSWRDNGGTVGSLRMAGRLMLINQTQTNHRRSFGVCRG